MAGSGMTVRNLFAIAPKLVASLVGARMGYRGTVLLANVVLAGAWGSTGYAGYAAAMGGAAFLNPIASLGIEKCALKLIPRARHIVARLIGVFVALAAVLLLVSLVILAVLLLGRSDSTLLPGLAGLWAICTGGNQVLVGLSRAVGRPGRDVANHLVLAVALAGLTVAGVMGTPPTTFLALYVLTLIVLNVALLAGLRPDFAGLRRTTLVRAAVGTSALMAVADVVGGVSISLLFLALSVTGSQAESGGLYLAVIASSVLLNAFAYLLRILQPQVSRGLHQRDLTSIIDTLARWLRLLVLTGVPYLSIALGVALLLFRDMGGPGVLILYAACVPILFLMGSVNYLMENATPEALRATAHGAAVSLAAMGALAFAIVPWAGALGAVTVLGCGEIVHAAIVLRWLIPRRSQAQSTSGV
jgi:O-antigen/teichoic acid export membrane protein